MPKLTHSGPGPVDLPSLGLVAQPGEPVDVPAEAVESLTAQGFTAAKATPPKAAKAATQEGDD